MVNNVGHGCREGSEKVASGILVEPGLWDDPEGFEITRLLRIEVLHPVKWISQWKRLQGINR
jgi:hypothetical protein